MHTTVSWNGTHREQSALLRAVSHSCACDFEQIGQQLTACSAHRMLAEDQRALDGLLFVRRLADRLRREEWLTNPHY
jgi:hypothetical protein